MDFVFYKAQFKTANKTPEQIKSDYDGGIGQVPSDEEIKIWIEVYNLINGIELVVMKSPISDGYIPVSWDENDDCKIRDFVYQAEQDPFFGTYINERVEFLNDWESGDYSPTGTLTFSTEDIEIIEELKKEQNR